MRTIIIHTWRGTVSEVYVQGDEDFEIEIFDEDDNEEEYLESKELLGTGGFTQVY